MNKQKTEFHCQSCGFITSKWLGKCPECNKWNTFSEEAKLKKIDHKNFSDPKVINKPKIIENIELINFKRIKTGIAEFDRVVGDGLAVGSLTLIGGEPGIGKSTLLMEVCGKISKIYKDEIILYTSGEESESQIASRSKRLGIDGKNFYILHESNWDKILENLKELKPKFFVLDSIQTTVSSQIDSAAGTVSQIREVTYELMNYAKANGITCFIIGHVTKEGVISGPKLLEHMVDTVISFEGDQFNYYRLLRVIKNRFGNNNEVGIFEMRETGLKEVVNPSQYFLDKSFDGAFGRSITCIMEGTRALFVEIQALVVENKYGNGRRTTNGLDNNRLAMLVAVLEKYFEIPLSFQDIYVNVVGGIKLNQRDSDLSIIASILSSFKSMPLDEKTVFIGEVGLTGEIRSIPMMEMRIKELDLLKYKRLVTSSRISNEIKQKAKIEIIGIDRVNDLARFF